MTREVRLDAGKYEQMGLPTQENREIRSSGGGGNDSVPSTVARWYDFREPGGYLWEFHRVHHSLEVMHPLSNYREHPIDNIVYAAGVGAAYGLLMGLASLLFGYVPSVPQLLGVPLVMFAFNILGYNLRHSHVWLRWPGRWSMLFASPAHHHIHHSCHPDHVDTNFAFIFPWWDVLFRTYCLPETNKDVRFGISMHYVTEFKSCLGIYFIPFRNAWRRFSKNYNVS